MKFKAGLAALAFAGAFTAASQQAAAQAYPSRPIHLVVSLAPGGLIDVIARPLGQKLSDELGQSVIVENRPGASEVVASEYVAKSAPDGYTLLALSDGALTVNPYLFKSLPYDPSKDFTPISRLTVGHLVLAVRGNFPANTLAEFVQYAKQNPGKVAYGSTGIGGAPHLSGEWFKSVAGIDLNHVPYKGSGPAAQDLIGGQLDSTWISPVVVAGQLPSGRVKVLAISGPRRLPSLPSVPTFEESGYKNYSADFWVAIVGPAGMPAEPVNKLAAAIRKVTSVPEFREKYYAVAALEAVEDTPAQFRDFLKHDQENAGMRIKLAKVKPE